MTSTIATPSPNDVLCGKDKTYQLHPGNRLYRRLIEEKAVFYSTIATKQDKMNMTQEIVATMTAEHGARFLRCVDTGSNDSSEEEECWEEITHQQARDKTSHALRFCAASSFKLKQPPKSSTSSSAHAPQTRRSGRKRRHRRTVSRDSQGHSSSAAVVPAAVQSSSHVPRVSWTTHDRSNNCHDMHLFERQQAILSQSHFHHHHVPQQQPQLSRQDSSSCEPIPIEATSSEDLDIILSQPLSVHDWDGLFQEI